MNGKEMNKKSIALFLAVLLTISVFPVTAFAETVTLNVSLDKTALEAGSEDAVNYSVVLPENSGIFSFEFEVTYDAAKLKLTNTKKLTGTHVNANVAGIVKFTTAYAEAITDELSFLTLTFQANADVEGDAVISTKITVCGGDNDVDLPFTNPEDKVVTITKPIIPVTGITISGADSITGIGNTTQLTVAAQPANATQPNADMSNVAWSTNNEKVATVENGLVTAVGEGTATITATFEGKTASKNIKVSKAIIDGKVNVPTKAVYGQMIEASYSGNAVSESGDIIRITWYRGETVIKTSHQYTPTADDVGKEIYVVVTSDKFDGKVESAKIKVEKATQDAPGKPTIVAEENKIKVTNVDSGAEYLLVGAGASQDFGEKTEFTVNYGMTYYVIARYPETATHKASEEAKSDSVTIVKTPYNLTVTASAGGSVSGIPKDTVREGDKVTLTAKPGDFDHKFVKWEVTGITLTDETATTITFTMGSTDVTVKAVFAEKEAVIINFNVLNFTYDSTPKTPEIGPEEVVGMDRTIEYFDSLNNKLKSAPTEAGTYKVKVKFTSSEASEYRTTEAEETFTIARAEQTAPDAPVLANATSSSFELNIVAEQEYVISTTQATPAESEWKKGTELISPVTGLEPAKWYYVYTRKAGDSNHNPSAAVNSAIRTLDTYKWEVEGSAEVTENVRVGGTLPESLTGTIKNIGTGELTGITATIDSDTNFTLEAVSGTLASNGSLNITVKPNGIKTDKEGEYKAAVTVKAKDVSDITVTFTIKVTKKDPAAISGITDTTVTFNGKTQGIDLSNAKVECNGKTLDASKLTVTYDAAETRNVGTYTATIKYEDTNCIGSTTAQLIIEKQDVTLTGLTVDNKDYKGDKAAYVHYDKAKLDGAIEGTDVNFDMTGIVFEFEDKNVGENKTVTNTKPITLTGADANNYNLINPFVELKGTITALPATVTLTVADKTYNGITDDAKVTMNASGIIAGDDVQLVATKGVYATADAGNAVEVTVTYTISGVDKDNYSYSIADKAYGKVEKRELTVTLTAPAAVTYDGNTHGVSVVEDNRVADKGKTLYTLTYNNNDALPVDANTYEVTAKLTDEGSKNYTLTANTVKLVINKADMTATDKGYSVAFMLAGAQTRPLSDLQLTPANISGKWSVAIKDNTENILDGASIDGENLVFTIKSGLGLGDIGGFAKLDVTFTPDKNYNPVTATVTVTLAQDTYTNSLVGTLPTQVKLGDTLDFTGVQLVTKFGSGAPDQKLDVTDTTKVEMTTTYDPAAKEIGVKTVTFTDKANGGITYTHTFTVVDVLEGVKLEADQVGYAYKLKEATTIGFDGKVYAVYKSGAKKALTHADVVLSMSDGTAVDSAKEARLLNTLGTATITLTYTEKYFDGTTDKQSVDITVSVTADPVKPDGKPNAEGFAVTPIPDAGKEMEYKDGAGNKVEPENVQGKLADAAPGTLEEEVKKNPAFNNVGNGDVVYENISFEDNTGKPVTFANGKMQVTVPYPADSDKGDEFVMIISDRAGHTETIVPIKTANGLQFITGLSDFTFAIGWYTPAPSPVLPTEPERDPEDNFWNEVYWTLLRSGQGSVITANAGYYDRVPQGVLRAVDISGNTLIINSAFGMQVVVNPGALEKLGMYRIFYPISYLKEMLKGSSVISGSGTTGITVGVLMPTTGDATVVEHPYSMTPATAGIIPGLESAANARPVIDNADGVSVLDGAQRNDGAVIGGGMLIGLGLLALLGAAYVTMRRRGN